MGWAAAAATGLALAGCGGRGISPGAQQAFVTQLGDTSPGLVAARGETALVRLGAAACAELSSGAGFAAVVDNLGARNPDLAPSAIGTLVTAAVDQLCPSHRGVLP